MESFFGTLKTELVHHREYPDRDTARRDLFAYIEGYYNGGASTPPSATSPHSRQRRNPRNPVSTFPGEGQRKAGRCSRTR
jgi:transposase InsO family protein